LLKTTVVKQLEYSEAAMIVYSVTNEASFTTAAKLLKRAVKVRSTQTKGSSKIEFPVYLVGTHADSSNLDTSSHKRQVSYIQGAKLALEYCVKFVEVGNPMGVQATMKEPASKVSQNFYQALVMTVIEDLALMGAQHDCVKRKQKELDDAAALEAANSTTGIIKQAVSSSAEYVIGTVLNVFGITF